MDDLMSAKLLNAKDARIFRLTHVANLRLCMDEESRAGIESVLAKEGVKMTVSIQPDWFLTP